MRKQGSRTAESSAAQRALHTLHGHDPKIFEDPFALELAGPSAKWIFGPRPAAWLLMRLYPWILPMVAHHLARARYVEELLDAMLSEGLEQYVLLGAGMDSFAFRRLDLTERLTVFEIDHPGTQAKKRSRLRKLGWPEPRHVRYVPVDFETQNLREEMMQGGLDDGKLTLVAWMGVAPYLTEESIANTLKDVAIVTPPGSEIVFDTLDGTAVTTGRDSVVGRRMFRAAKWMGEPMISGFDPPEISRILNEAGFEMVEVVSPDAFARLWFDGRSDLPPPWEHVYVVRARVC